MMYVPPRISHAVHQNSEASALNWVGIVTRERCQFIGGDLWIRPVQLEKDGWHYPPLERRVSLNRRSRRRSASRPMDKITI